MERSTLHCLYSKRWVRIFGLNIPFSVNILKIGWTIWVQLLIFYDIFRLFLISNFIFFLHSKYFMRVRKIFNFHLFTHLSSILNHLMSLFIYSSILIYSCIKYNFFFPIFYVLFVSCFFYHIFSFFSQHIFMYLFVIDILRIPLVWDSVYRSDFKLDLLYWN